ncbi:anti-sigma factor domain-containing protein [Flavimarina sp. Hel_I_48]|uniref:anti-sigma factor n=1 Tax=Flavimarina sp. Hel_I_48 TaxID=1392488 RepID=UPI0004DEE82A|nr:anti-sigma factor [Flavimarina sp. Hel_I_48]
MNIQEYISSGILELYVCGALTEEESREVSATLREHEEVRSEVEEIESALQSLGIAAAPYNPEKLLAAIKAKLGEKGSKVVSIPQEKSVKRQRVLMYLSLAASIALLIGLFSLLSKNSQLREELNRSDAQRVVLSSERESAESKLTETQNDLNDAQNILNVFRDTNTLKIPLAGQEVAPQSYANVLWNKAGNKVYIDAKGLPQPPEGKVYQVWSLKMNPLAPTSIGLLENFDQDENKIFELDNPNNSEAFGITLEPAGGSKTPTMAQLYTLGAISS